VAHDAEAMDERVRNDYFSHRLPEPSTLGLLAVGITAFIVRRRRSSGA